MTALPPNTWIPTPATVSFAALTDPPTRDPRLKRDAQAVSAFAAANGWEYEIGSGAQPLPGVVFRDDRGRPRHVQRAGDIVRVPGPAGLEVGNSAYSFVVNLNQFSVEWGYAAVRLPYAVPPLIAESRRARSERALPALPELTPLPLAADRDAGDLYADPADSAWAAAVMTPELVTLLDDEALALNLEIADGWLLLYHPGRLSVPDPGVWQRVLSVLEVAGRALAAAAPKLSAASHTGAPAVGAVPAGTRASASAARSLPVRERSADVTRKTTWTYYGITGGLFIVGMIVVSFFMNR
ncbi:hypothetical protein [uncultured Microbacterium sp.]|uniref:hypothetical protein n=1 Tax=uncultured Microbacterium sp. TaxID=191216 RepID=UPI0025F2182E|nr:hypothetical protein [uncultured Microbacterium sp.]